MIQETFSVSQITRHIKDLLDGDPSLRDLWIEGEISNWSRSRAGHCYFTLKDAEAAIRSVIWRTSADSLSFAPHDGQAVLAHGYVSLYEPQGQYQFYVDALRPRGRGRLYLQFEELKERLEDEGLFAVERKRPLPPFPSSIGIVTSPTGAALQDILRVLGRRWPVARVILSPTLVQGADAPPRIVAALRALYRLAGVDLIIVARGGGSIEDLWAFNDEHVGRTIADSPVPVVSGVGHQVDFTIADFVADLRAPTPSAAAEMSVPDQTQVRRQLASAMTALTDGFQRQIRDAEAKLSARLESLMRLSPRSSVGRDRQRVDDLLRRQEQALRAQVALLAERLSGLNRRMEGLSPTATLQRGYAIVRREDGEVVRRVAQAAVGTSLTVQVSDGEFAARVEETPEGVRCKT